MMKLIKIVYLLNLFFLSVSVSSTLWLVSIDPLYECNPIARSLASHHPLLLLILPTVLTSYMTAAYYGSLSVRRSRLRIFSQTTVFAFLPILFYAALNDAYALYNVVAFSAAPAVEACTLKPLYDVLTGGGLW